MSDTPIMMGNTKQQVITGVVKVKIAKPKFDITKHEWQGGHEIRSCLVYDDVIELNIDLRGEDEEAYLNKADAIAIAKHFKLKESDLA